MRSFERGRFWRMTAGGKMLNSIHIRAFKSLHDLQIELGSVNVFIGANGSGKSNILEAIGVLSSAASGRVDDEALLRRGVRPGLPRLYKSSFKKAQTSPYITIEAQSDHASYSVSLLNPLQDPKPAGTFKNENLQSKQVTIIDRGAKKNLGSNLEFCNKGSYKLKITS